MKKINLWLFSAILVCGLAVTMFTSCVEKADNPSSDVTPVVEETDYTVMLYTVGGGNLDYNLEQDIAKAAAAIKNDNKKVRYIVQYKYSSENSLAMNPYFVPSGKAGHLYRYEATPAIVNPAESPMLLLKDNQIYGTQNAAAELYQPDSIANFMKYCKQVAPAKNYILVISDHGNGYGQVDDYDKSLFNNPMTRSVVMDDNLDSKSISCKELRAGLEKSGMHLTMLYFDCCLMNNMETLSELTALTDYVLASGHTIAAGNHTAFVEELYKASAGDAFTEAMSRYARKCTEFNYEVWEEQGSEWARNVDFVLTDMKKFPAILPALKAYVDYIVANKSDDYADEYQYAASECYQYYPDAPLYDLRDYCEKLNTNVYGSDPDQWMLYDNLENALEAAQVCHHYSIQSEGYEEITPYWLSYNVNLGAKGFIGCSRIRGEPTKIYGVNKDGYITTLDMNTFEQSTMGVAQEACSWSNTYYLLEFDKQTGWSRWLEANTGYPMNNPPYDNWNDQLPSASPESEESEESASTDKEWEMTISATFETEKPTMMSFNFQNYFVWQGVDVLGPIKMTSPIYSKAFSDINLPAKAQLILEVEPKAGREGAWCFIRVLGKIEVKRIKSGKPMEDVTYTIDDVNLGGDDIQAEGADVAKKAYVNIEIDVDVDGNVKFTKHEKSESYIVEK